MFCYNAQVASTVTVDLRGVAATAHVPLVAVYETMPTPGYDYQSWMLAEIAAMTAAARQGYVDEDTPMSAGDDRWESGSNLLRGRGPRRGRRRAKHHVATRISRSSTASSPA